MGWRRLSYGPKEGGRQRMTMRAGPGHPRMYISFVFFFCFSFCLIF